MLKFSLRKYLLLAVAVGLPLFIGYENLFVHKFGECLSAYDIQSGKNTSNIFSKTILVAIDTVGRETVCTVRLIDKHNGFFGFIATLVIAAFTIVLASVTNRQAQLTLDAITLTRNEFNATHRPKLILREAFIGDAAEGKPIAITFKITNIGETRGWIVNSNFYIEAAFSGSPTLILAADSDGQNNAGIIGGIAPGESREGISVSPIHTWSGDYRAGWIPDAMGVFFVGHFAYVDEPGSNIRRQTAFRRKLKFSERRFKKIYEPGSEFEYAD